MAKQAARFQLVRWFLSHSGHIKVPGQLGTAIRVASLMVVLINDIAGKSSLFWGFAFHVGDWLCWQLLACSILWFHRQVEACWNAACGMPVLDFVLVTRKKSGVPIFPKGSSFLLGIWEYGDPGSPKFFDTSIYCSQYEFFCKIKSLRKASWRVLCRREAWHCDTIWYRQDTWPAICSPLFTLVVSLARSLMCCSTNSCSY